MYYLFTFGISLLLTLVIEILIGLIWGMRNGRQILLVILVNILTNPCVNFLNLCGKSLWNFGIGWQIVLEIAAAVAEAGIYVIFSKKDGWNIRHPVLLSVCANAVSYGIGCIISAFVVI